MNEHLPDLRQHPDAIRVCKKPIPVKVHFADAPGICPTLEGPVHYQTGDAIMTGIAGESWPILRFRFDERYEPAAETRQGEDGHYIRRSSEVLALHLNAPLHVNMAAGGHLTGEPGNWLIQYEPGDYGILENDIFYSSYQILE